MISCSNVEKRNVLAHVSSNSTCIVSSVAPSRIVPLAPYLARVQSAGASPQKDLLLQKIYYCIYIHNGTITHLAGFA